MKKIISIISVVIALAGCASRELDVLVNVDNTEVTDPSDDSAPIEKGRIVTISAVVSENHETKSEVSDGGKFVWNEGDQIGVYTKSGENVGNMKSFSYVANSGKIFESDDAFVSEETVGDLAISPFSDDNLYVDYGGGNNALTIVLPSSFDWEEGNSHAVMLATGMGASAEAEQEFEFHHIGAIVKFTYENIPTGAKYFNLVTKNSDDTARNIAGTFAFEDIDDFDAVKLIYPTSGGNNDILVEFDEVTEVNTSKTFFIPVPTGDYSKFELALYDKEMELIDGTKKKATWNISLKPADVLVFPSITLTEQTPSVYAYEKISSTDNLTDGLYLIVYEDGNAALNASASDIDSNSNDISISFTNGKISSSDTVDAAAFTYSATSGTLSNSAGKYISASGNNLSLVTTSTTVSITFDNNKNAIIKFGSNTYPLRYNTSWGAFRCYSSGQQAIQLYKKDNNAGFLNTPRNLLVEGRRLTWDSVPNAVSYTVKIGSITVEGITNTYYELVSDTEDNKYLRDDYYDVSVIAKSGDTKRKDSTPATLTKAKFGTPTLEAPTELAVVSNTVFSREFSVSWAAVSNATSYHYSIKTGESEIASGTTEDTNVLFEGLTASTAYKVHVYAEATTGDYPYAQSEEAEPLDKTTPADETLSSISDTKVHKVYGVTVGAISTKGFYIYDSTAGMMVVQDTTSPNDIAVGDLVDVKGTTGTENSVYHFKSGVTVSNKRSGAGSDNPYTITEVDASVLSSLASSFSKEYLSVFGTVNTVNKSSGYYYIKVGSETSKYIALHAPISSIKDNIVVNQDVIVTGYTYKMTGSTTKYIYIVADSFNVIQLTASPTSATWSTWKDLTSKTITVTSDDSAWTFNDSAVSSWLSVTRGTGENINKLTLTPKSTNDSKTAREPANITLTHATVSGKTTTIACSMPAKPTVGNVSSTQTGRYVTLACATAGATIKYTTDGTDPAQYGVNYSTPISFTSNKRLRAVGILEDYFNSTELDQNITAPTPNLAVSGDASYDGTNKILTLGGAAASGAKTLSVTSYYAWNASKGGSDTFTFAKKDANNSAVAADVDVDLNGSITVTPPSDADTARDLGTLTLTDSQGTEISITIKQAAKGNAPAAGTVLFSDSFTSAANGTSARVYYSSSSSTAAYDVEKYNSTLTYTSSGGVSCESTSYAGGSAKEIQVNKNGGSLTISGIKTYGATTVNVSFKYKCNLTTAPITATCGSTDSSNFSSTSATTASFNATVSGDTFNLVIRKTSTANSSAARFDDISITVVE